MRFSAFRSCAAGETDPPGGGAVVGPLHALRPRRATPARAETLQAEADLRDVEETTF